MNILRAVLLLVLCLGGLAPMGGCSCWKDPLAKVGSEKKRPETLEEMEARRKELQEKQEEKPDFETARLTVLPADDAPTKNQVKPGHWFNAVQTMKANNFDFPKGDLDAQCVDMTAQPIPLPGTNFDLRISRPVSLPKGQEKHFDLLLFANMPRKKGAINFITRLRPRGGGREVDWKHEATTRMKPFQNHLVVLAERVDNYQFIKALRSVKPERSSDEFLSAELDYFVKLPKGTRRVDLPSHPLAWSNIAYVIWDDFEPEILNTSQQQAMIDWLHWGGQLIINGPRTLDRLASSFIAPYLPARSGEVSSLSDEQIDHLNAFWSFDEEGARPLHIKEKTDRPVTIVLDVAKQARIVPNTADLVADLHVGRGRVVTTAFNLPHEVFLSWDAYDSFFNACLLDRPARNFFSQRGGAIVERWAIKDLTRDDPRLTSKMRYFSRDAMALSTRSQRSREKAREEEAKRRQERAERARMPTAAPVSLPIADVSTDSAESEPEDPSSAQIEPYMDDAFGVAGFAKDDLIGVAGWSDQSDVSQAARASLQMSAGISVPSIDFIAKVLGVYLLVLVPLNWLIFRLMGRVEWAWAAVPLIAIGGALGVVQAAQLDIGFARSRTEIAVVEIQPDYDRAHLTRYIGFYSSLSSSYEIAGTDESSLFQPLASSQRVGDRRVALYQGDGVSLSGFNVLSNSTGLVHGEQMLELGGKLTLLNVGGNTVVDNQTDHDLRGTAIVRSDGQGVVEVAWVGELKSKGQSGKLDFQPQRGKSIEFAEWEALPATSRDSVEGDLNLRRLIDIATDRRRLGRGETVLVGWNDQLVAGVNVRPKASQTTARALFVAQLRHGARPDPEKDINSFATLDREKKQRAKENLDNGDFDF